VTRDPDHPTFGLEPAERRRRIDQSAADLRAANTWMRAEVEAMNAARWAARRDQAVCIGTYGTLAAFWVVVILLAVAVLGG
jgi:hypothetical protein